MGSDTMAGVRPWDLSGMHYERSTYKPECQQGTDGNNFGGNQLMGFPFILHS